MHFDHLGPYKIGKRIGRGGMGTVYEAVNTQTNEDAAVKVLSPVLADEEGFRERFAIEIETLKRLRHPQIVKLYGFGEHSGILYYAMELVRGVNLEDELQNGRRYSWREVTQTGVKLSRALKLAHDFGIVHRDLKPANILVTPDDDIKLTDFGIARLFGAMNLTSDGGLVGTAEYMSPEQAEGKPVNFSSDLYSLGAVMFAMLAGRPPFRAKSLPEVLQMQRFAEPPRVSQYAHDTPIVLTEIITRLLSKEPEKRAANAGLLTHELAAMEHGLIAKTNRSNTTVGTSPSGENFNDESRARSETVNSEMPELLDPDEPTRVANKPVTIPVQSRAPQSSEATSVFNDPTAAGSEVTARVSFLAPPIINRFTTVEDEEALNRQTQRRLEKRRLALQASILGGVLLGIIGIAWWLSRPPSADEMYAKIQAAAQTEQIDKLLDQRDAVVSFLAKHPDHPKAAEVKKWYEEIALEQYDRQLDVRARTHNFDESLSPAEYDYLRVLQTMNSDSTLGYDQLKAYVTLYQNANKLDDNEQKCLQLARRQLERGKPAQDSSIPQRVEFLDAQLQAAKNVQNSNPKLARELCESIVTLYKDRTWAAKQVEQATMILKELQVSEATENK